MKVLKLSPRRECWWWTWCNFRISYLYIPQIWQCMKDYKITQRKWSKHLLLLILHSISSVMKVSWMDRNSYIYETTVWDYILLRVLKTNFRKLNQTVKGKISIPRCLWNDRNKELQASECSSCTINIKRNPLI